MRKFEVYQRGSVFRVARPGLIFWHTEFETGDYRVAVHEAAKLNLKLTEKLRYSQDHWKKLED